MTTVTLLHDQAMEFADLAFLAKRQGNLPAYREYVNQAYQLERKAAEELQSRLDLEPSRSVLYRSAASLALDAGLEREAEKLIAIALSGEPPNEVAEELRDLLDQVNFQRHLRLRGIELEQNEFQLSIAGNAIAPGMTPSELFLDRIKDIERVFIRTAERLSGIVFRERGSAKKTTQNAFNLFMSVPRAASFAVTIRLGRQSQLPKLDDSPHIIEEVIDCMRLFSDANDKGLRERIQSDAYYQNFIGLAKRIAPDGKKVSVVGLTAMDGTNELKVAINRRKKDLTDRNQPTPERGNRKSNFVTITGKLLFADGLKITKRIQVLDEKSGATYNVSVPDGMMTDIVRPLWEEMVVITGTRKGKTINLSDIEKANS